MKGMSKPNQIKTVPLIVGLLLFLTSVTIGQPPSGPYFGQQPPGSTPKIFAPGFISTALPEFAGVFSPDGTEFFFTHRSDTQSLDNSLFYTRTTDGVWSVPQPASFSTNYDEMEPQFSPDGSRLYFGSERPKPAGDVLPGGIWYSEKTATGRSPARHLQAPVNDDFAMYISSTRSGTLYVTAMVRGRVGICRCPFKNGAYGAMELIPVVDPPVGAAHPFVSPDEDYLIFDAQDESGPGPKPNLYVSFRAADGSWGKGIKLPASINTKDTELGPSVSPDGKYLFFSRFSGKGADIYWVDFEVVRKLKQP